MVPSALMPMILFVPQHSCAGRVNFSVMNTTFTSVAST